jgi:hypothetical protein
MAQPKKIELNEIKDSRPIEIRRVKNGYLLSENADPRNMGVVGEMLVFNKIEQLYTELKDRFEPKKKEDAKTNQRTS